MDINLHFATSTFIYFILCACVCARVCVCVHARVCESNQKVFKKANEFPAYVGTPLSLKRIKLSECPMHKWRGALELKCDNFDRLIFFTASIFISVMN